MQITVKTFASGLYNITENLNSKSLSHLTHAANKRINANMPLFKTKIQNLAKSD